MSFKQSKKNINLPSDTFFYTLPLEQPGQRLTQVTLNEHYNKRPGRKAYMGNRYEYIRYAHGVLTMRIFLNDNTQHDLFIHVGMDELHVACSCGMEDGTLCYHAYMGLYFMSWRDYKDFQMYYWPGYDANEDIRRKFLIVCTDKKRITVEPKLRYGNIFRPLLGFTDNKHLSIKPQAVGNIPAGNREVMAYCLGYNCGGYFSAGLPMLVPCLAVTDKYDKHLVSYKQFNSPKKPVSKIPFTREQETLNAISLKQYQIADNYEGLSNHEKQQKQLIAKQQMLDLWQEAFPMLIEEKFTCAYYLHWTKYVNEKPKKSFVSKYRFSADKPRLTFVLKFHGDHFSLVAEVFISGSRVQEYRKPHLFLIDEESGTCYLMRSVQDDDLLLWILSNSKRLTILKEHFPEFHDTFLNQVSKCYDVMFANNGKGKKYNYENVLKETQ